MYSLFFFLFFTVTLQTRTPFHRERYFEVQLLKHDIDEIPDSDTLSVPKATLANVAIHSSSLPVTLEPIPETIAPVDYETHFGIPLPVIESPSVAAAAQFINQTSREVEYGQYCKDFCENIVAVPPQFLPTEKIDWTTDENTVTFFFDGLGASTLKQARSASTSSSQVFFADFRYMSKLFEPSQGYAELGGKIYFKVTKTEDKVERSIMKILFGRLFSRDTTSSRTWEYLKLKLRTSALAEVTFQDHLIWLHLRWSGMFVKAVDTAFAQNTSHPLYSALYLHTHGVNDINNAGRVLLLPEFGLFNRAFAWSFESLSKTYTTLFRSFSYQSWKDEIKVQGLDAETSVYVARGNALHPIFHTYVSNVLRDIFPSRSALSEDDIVRELWALWSEGLKFEKRLTLKNLIDVVTEIIFRVTFYHDQVGRVLDYAFSSKFISTRQEIGPRFRAENDKSGTYWWLIISIFTGSNEIPLLDESHADLFSPSHAEHWRTFVSALRKLDNEHPEWELNRLETSVSK